MNTADFRIALNSRLEAAIARGVPFVDVNAGDLHRAVGGYPGRDHRLPLCCQVLKDELGPRDEIVASPASGKGASLTIRYQLPR